jgi:hypothetical protein
MMNRLIKGYRRRVDNAWQRSKKIGKDKNWCWEKDITAKNNSTHHFRGIHVGAGIDQQPHAVRVTIRSGKHQSREPIVLRVEL